MRHWTRKRVAPARSRTVSKPKRSRTAFRRRRCRGIEFGPDVPAGGCERSVLCVSYPRCRSILMAQFILPNIGDSVDDEHRALRVGADHPAQLFVMLLRIPYRSVKYRPIWRDVMTEADEAAVFAGVPAPEAGLGLAGLAPDGVGTEETRDGEKHDPRTPDMLLPCCIA